MTRTGRASLGLLVSWVVALGCVGDAPDANDPTPAPTDDSPNDRPSANDASPSESEHGGCTPSTGVTCRDPTTLVRCRDDGGGTEVVACERGCNEQPTPHCALIVPTGIAPGFLLAGGGGGAGNLADGNGVDAATDHTPFVSRGGYCGTGRCGGDGAHTAGPEGKDGTLDGQVAGAGGGGAGRIRIDTLTRAAELSAPNTLFVPQLSSPEVFAQGIVTIE